MPPRPRQATADDLIAKPARRKELSIPVGDRVLTVSLVAIGADEYDELLAAHPPTKEQRVEGNSYNPDTFAPALIAECAAEPKLSLEQTTAIWKGSTWSRGELRDLFMACVNLCQQGLDVPFTLAD
jgi:hypothetical protein